jgi:hypothetical protein
MKLGIMQPYFFPYLGYFSLIKNTNKWVFLDLVQYIKHGWINRNRILNPLKGWQYIIVPLKKYLHTAPIKDIKIASSYDWKRKIIRQLGPYKKKAPYYEEVTRLVEEIFKYNTDSIDEFNIFSLKKTCEFLNIPFNYEVLSMMDITIGKINEPDDWALEISKSLNAKEYINAPGGRKFFHKSKFVSSGINLNFLQINLREYDQKRDKFEPGLSIIDVMMFNSKEKIQDMLDDYELL